MSALAYKFATYEDLFDLPEQIVGEIIHGQLITHPRFDAIAFPLMDLWG
jgi:hypothetical protein